MTGAECKGYWAHSRNSEGYPDLLCVHLSKVSERAAEFAWPYGAESEARIAGLLHDVGKYGTLFQRRLQGKEHGIDHWSAGAWEVLRNLNVDGIAAALAIQGHHIGLQAASRDHLSELEPSRCSRSVHPLRLAGPHEEVVARMQADGLSVAAERNTRSLYAGIESASAGMLDVRLLFSALVDADYLETEAHFGGQVQSPSLKLDPEYALSALHSYMRSLQTNSDADERINGARRALFEACCAAGSNPQGLYTLTAPTGSGKTLAMLAFALSHALRHGLRRLVVVLPYLTVIEQTARVYRAVFDGHARLGDYDRYVIEDHSMAGTRRSSVSCDGQLDLDSPRVRSRMLETSTWDAPVIITTSVQFLESLFAHRPGPCRKLHNLARSVVVFDEVQTLPLGLAIPTLATLSRLSEAYGTTIVFSTATQPAFAHLNEHVRCLGGSGWSPSEIVPDHRSFARSSARRIRVEWPCAGHSTWETVAEAMMGHSQALCVVNLKRHATRLFTALHALDQEGCLHLSTNMCPVHRQDVLREVRQRLSLGQPCRLVATQCVEAGVDLDFPYVLRALGPLDSIAQAAGRCNRNGRQSLGLVRIFIPEGEAYPNAAYQRATSVTRAMLQAAPRGELDLHDPDVYERYYAMLYDLSRPDRSKEQLVDAIQRQDFPQVAQLYRVIPGDAVNILVPYDELAFEDLRAATQEGEVGLRWIASARPHAVSIFRPASDDPAYSLISLVTLTGGATSEQWFLCTSREAYDERTGLMMPSTSRCLIA